MNAFAITLGLGAAFGLYRVSRQRAGLWLDAALVVLALAFVGARVGYVLVNQPYFSMHLIEAFQFWRGGLSAAGAVIGGFLGLILAAALNQTPLFRMADWLYPIIPPIAVTAWLGCWLSGVGYGDILQPDTWWSVRAIDEAGQVASRVPVQLGAAIGLSVFYMLLEYLTPLPRPSGWFFSLAVSWLLLVSLVASLFRADPMPTFQVWRDLRLDTMVYLITFIPFFGLFVYTNFAARKLPKGQAAEA